MSIKLASLAPWQFVALNQPYVHFAMYAGVACVRASTMIETIDGPQRIDQISAGTRVLSLTANGEAVWAKCNAPFAKGRTRLLRVRHEHGEFFAHEYHLICIADGSWRYVRSLDDQTDILAYRHEFSRDPRVKLLEDFQSDCLEYNRLHGAPLRAAEENAQFFAQQSIDAKEFCPEKRKGALRGHEPARNHFSLSQSHPSNSHFYPYRGCRATAEGAKAQDAKPYRPKNEISQDGPLFQTLSECRHIDLGSFANRSDSSSVYMTVVSRVISVEKIEQEEEYWDIEIPVVGNYLAHGCIHHNTGKTFTGSHFAITQIISHPEMTGFAAANTYDQLSQATLRELFYWLETYGLDFVIDRQPPAHWRARRALKDYHNTLHVHNRYTGKTTLVFTRVLSDPNPLRGIEFSWYWLDETRDTPEITHDVVLSRMRETPNYQRGIITTTPNGEDWSYKRFVKGNDGSMTYGSLHVPTRRSLELGIITQQYYDTLLKSYSPMMALQELEAQHVNILGGKAYYSASEQNRRRRAPWGDEFPTRERPLIIGCDFNFSPSPCVWMVGQVGPPRIGLDGIDFSECIHWFYELAGRETSTVDMARNLLGQFPDYFYRIYGDSSGGVGTTSNAGETDYNQIAATLGDAMAMFSIDYLQADEDESRANPRVRSRVENFNRLLKNAIGEIRMTYDPATCPLLDGDMKMVGWKAQTSAGRGKLDDNGDKDRTHASDGAGYAVYKLFPPGRRGQIVSSLPSTVRLDHGILIDR